MLELTSMSGLVTEYAAKANPSLTRPEIEEKIHKGLTYKLSNFKRSPKGLEIIEAEKRRVAARFQD